MTKINIFDQTLKIITRHYADLWLQLALPNIPVRLVGTLENVELSLPVRPVDFLHRVVCQGQEYLLHIEFQLEHKADFPRRMCSYHGIITEQFRLPVLSLVLYLSPRQASLPNEYVVQVGGQMLNRFSYPVLKLWDYVEEIRSGQYRELAPLLVMLVAKPDESTLEKERELILAEPDKQKRVDLLALAVTVAARYFDKAFLWRFFREELEQMREATFIEDWIQESLQQGIEQGRQEGAVQTQRASIQQILRARFDLRPSQVGLLARQLESVNDLSELIELTDHALRDFALTDFNVHLSHVAAGQPA